MCAVQTLYGNEFAKNDIKKVIADFKQNGQAFLSESISVSEMDTDFFSQLLEATSSNLSAIDEIISTKLAATWKPDRLDPVIRSILRLGVSELMNFPEIPTNVIFNEYIEISKAFFGTNDVAFVNGLLNKAAKKIRKE